MKGHHFILGFLFYFLFLDLKMLFIMAKLYVCVWGGVYVHMSVDGQGGQASGRPEPDLRHL